MTTTDPVTTYFEAWRDKDVSRLRPMLADDVVFDGPLAHVDGADECVASLEKLASITKDLKILHRFEDDDDFLTWFELTVEGAPPTPVANWSHVEDGLITRIRVTFDPRGMLGS